MPEFCCQPDCPGGVWTAIFLSLVTMPVRILLVSGSLREGSTNTAVLKTAEELAPAGVMTTRYRGMDTLPHFNPDDDREGKPVHPAVQALRAEIAAADALLICTPEYAGALPGALKNLLEWTVGDGGTYRKPIAWINASGPAAPTGGADAHESLRKVLGYVHADIVEEACARIPVTRDAIGTDDMLADPTVRREIAAVLSTLGRRLVDRDEPE
jgi:NAD(P)H-dependent FMN reductase